MKRYIALAFITLISIGLLFVTSANTADAATLDSEGFETNFGDWTADSGSCTWGRNSGTTSSGSTGPSGANNGTYYIYAETSSSACTSDYAEITYGPFNASTYTDLDLSFYYHMYGSSTGNVTVQIDTGSGWTTVDTITGQQHTSEAQAFTQRNVNLASYVGASSTSIKIRYTGSSSFTGDTAIDDVEITYTSGGGGGSNWNWVGNGNSSYNGTVSGSSIGTIPSGSTNWAFAVWAGESNYQDLSGDEGNYSVSFNGTTSCSVTSSPGGVSFETDCVIFPNISSSQTNYQVSGITECNISFNNSTRAVTFTDNSGSESCHYAVFSNGESSGGSGGRPFYDAHPSGYTATSGNYTMGYRFTPDSNGQITHLWCFGGGTRTVYLFADNGTQLASTSVNCSGTWNSGAITPVNVTAGTYYKVAHYTSGSTWYYKDVSSVPFSSSGITIAHGIYGSGNTNPTITGDLSGRRISGLSDVTFVPSGGGGSGGWTWVGNGNSSYNGTVSNSTIGTIPEGATNWAFAAWADESGYQNISGDQGNYTVSFNGTSSCTNSTAPGSGSVETDCVVFPNITSSQSYSPSGITECDIFYNNSTRVVTFTDNSTGESCHFAVFYYGSAATPTPTSSPTPTRTPTPTFTPTPTPVPFPSVTTNAASSVTQTTATINATADPNGYASTGWFRYYTSNPGSCTDSGGTRVPSSSGTSLGSGTTGVAYNRSLTDLSAGTTYYVCAFASNTNGTGVGNPVSFSTNAGTPTSVTNSGESNLGSFYATLNASANPNNFASYGYFRVYGSNPGSCTDTGGTRYPTTETGDDLSLGSSGESQSYSHQITFGLTPETTYYYCAFSRNSHGTVASTVDAFTTIAGPISACDPPASGNHTIISSCAYSGDVGGVDAIDLERPNRNSGVMTINSGKLLTTNPDQQVAWGGINIDGAINIAPGAALRAAPVWVTDADGDGYISSNEQFIGTQPEGGARRSAVAGNYAYYSKIANAETFDCNDDNEYIYVNRSNMVTDADNDGYKTSTTAGTQCAGDSSTINGRTYYRDASGAYKFLPDAQKLSTTADCDDATGAPCQPTTPSVSNPGQTSLSVSWSPTTGPAATSYTLRWCQGASCTPETNISGISSGSSSYNHNSSLSCGQTYRYRIVAINDAGQTGSGIGQGTTSACVNVPTLSSSPTVSSISQNGAILGGNVTNNGGETLNARGTCWGTSSGSVNNCQSAGGTSTGSFSHSRTGMSCGDVIYYRAYATNSAGTGYSNISSFNTSACTLPNGSSCTTDSQCQSGNCYVDNDGDRYAPSSGSKICRASSQLSGTDCNDGNSNVRPNQTSYFTSGIDGGFNYDYNCNGQTDYLHANQKHSFTAASGTCYASRPSGTVGWYTASSVGCGLTHYTMACGRWSTTACGTWAQANTVQTQHGFACPAFASGAGYAINLYDVSTTQACR